MSETTAPFPFKKIAIALDITPTASALFAESLRMARQYKAQLWVFHVSEDIDEFQAYFDNMMMEFAADTETCRLELLVGDVVQSLLEACKAQQIDLLIFGALKQERFMNRFFLGSVARDLCRKAKCSLLLLINPSNIPKGFKSLVVSGVSHPKTLWTFKTAAYIGIQEQAHEIYVLKELHLPGMRTVLVDEYSKAEEEGQLHSYIQEAREECEAMIAQVSLPDALPVKVRVVQGKAGHHLASFAQAKAADLLLINSPDKKLGFIDRLFAQEVEHLLGDLPCNMMIIHSRGF